MDEEAQKRKTDCVYFLASPLTCKKGNDCEYRHSENARINPRDCWYWLAGNCLNAFCPFRHPPLDGLPTASSPPGVPPTKSRVPCYFFVQGFCTKGDKCTFMHFPAPSQSTEAMPQKPPNSDVKGDHKHWPVTQENGSAISKSLSEPLREVQSVPEIKSVAQTETQPVDANARATQPTHKAIVMTNATVKGSAPEGSGSSELARTHGCQPSLGEEKLRKNSIEEGQFCLYQPADERSRQIQSGEDRLWQVQSQVKPVDDRLRQVHSGEERMQNGVDSEDWWEESSPGFDVLVDDAMDQLVYPDDSDYLSHHEVAVESRGRMMQANDLTEFDYEHLSAYEQSGRYDALGKYDRASFDPYDQQLGYDHVSLYDNLGRHLTVEYSGRPLESMALQKRRGPVLHEARRNITSDDLRHHISKRRRLNRTQRIAGDNQDRKHYQELSVREIQSDYSHRNDHSRQQEVLAQHQVLMQQGMRLNHRLSYGRTESSGRRGVSHERGLDFKRETPERIPARSTPNGCNHRDNGRSNAKGRDCCLLASESVTVSEFRSYDTTSSKKSESRKAVSNFTGPKSLAQIKAEKRRASAEESTRIQDISGEPNVTSQLMLENKNSSEEQLLKSQNLPASGHAFETGHRGLSVGGDGKISGKFVAYESSNSLDFEGPKPLSAILKEKQKASLHGDLILEEARKCQSLGAASDGSVTLSTVRSVSSFEKDVEDGELLQDGDPASTRHLGYSTTNKRDGEMLTMDEVDRMNITMPVREKCISSVVVATTMLDEVLTDRQWIREGGDTMERIDQPEAMEDVAELSDSAVHDTEIVMDDDEEDDFAKRLGGFFS